MDIIILNCFVYIEFLPKLLIAKLILSGVQRPKKLCQLKNTELVLKEKAVTTGGTKNEEI